MVESDTAMAQEESKREMEQRAQQKAPPNNSGGNAGQGSSTKSRRHSLPNAISPKSPPPPRAAVTPVEQPPVANGLLLLLLDRDNQPLPPNYAPQPTPRSKGKKLSFKLSKSPSKRSDSVFKFKKQFCVLHGANGLYQLRYGDSYSSPVAGVHEFITTGCSSIDHSPRSSTHSFGFEIVINGNHADAPVLCCAAETEEDFLMWMSALTSVIDGTMDSQHEGSNHDQQLPLQSDNLLDLKS